MGSNHKGSQLFPKEDVRTEGSSFQLMLSEDEVRVVLQRPVLTAADRCRLLHHQLATNANSINVLQCS